MEPIDEAPISNKRKIGTPKLSAAPKPKVPKARVPKTPKVRSSIQNKGRNVDNQLQQYMRDKKSNKSSFNNTGKIPTRKNKIPSKKN